MGGGGPVPSTTDEDSEEFGVFKELVRETLETDPQKVDDRLQGHPGRHRRDHTGVHRLYQLAETGDLLFPLINVNDSVTKSKFDNKYGCRHSLIDGLNRATDVLIGGKVAVVMGYGDVGKGCAQSLAGQGARVIVTEVDPICALQAAMEGFQVARLEDVVETADIFITCTGCFDVITAEQMQRMKNKAIVANIGHFDNEIDMAGLAKVPGVRKTEIKPQVHEWTFTNGPSIIVLSEEHLMNLGNATGHPSFVMSNSFSNQTIAQIELFTKTGEYQTSVYTLPKAPSRKVARLHLDALGVRLTELTKGQAEYLGVDVAGPYKPEHYRDDFGRRRLTVCRPRSRGGGPPDGCGHQSFGQDLGAKIIGADLAPIVAACRRSVHGSQSKTRLWRRWPTERQVVRRLVLGSCSCCSWNWR